MQMLPNALAKRPHTAESDFTGVVVATQGVTGFSAGEAVCGWIPQCERSDGYWIAYLSALQQCLKSPVKGLFASMCVSAVTTLCVVLQT
jgi:NADPH:quinone reductase-like Zn-dependent oxidoreductase